MTAMDRYVVLGLAPHRSAWFSEVAQWAHAGVVPIEFVKCVSTEELRARLTSTRLHSAVLVDASAPALDRDLLEAARRRGCAVLVVGAAWPGAASPADAGGLPVDACLARRFSPADLTAALSGSARPIGMADSLPAVLDPEPPPQWRGHTAMVCGAGGTGVSTVAIALAQGLATSGQRTVLADLALRAEQGMLHGAPDVSPGVQELAEAHRAPPSRARPKLWQPPGTWKPGAITCFWGCAGGARGRASGLARSSSPSPGCAGHSTSSSPTPTPTWKERPKADRWTWRNAT
jgi:hypothetical protein